MFLSKHPNGTYYLWYVDENNKKQKISTRSKTKADALKFLKDFNLEKYRQSERIRCIHLSEFTCDYANYSKANHRPTTTRTAITALKELSRKMGNPLLSRISVHDIESFFTSKAQECNSWALLKYYVTLKSIFNTAKRWEYITVNPFSKIPKPRPAEQTPVYFTHADFTKLLRAIDDSDFKELVLFALMSGMRQSEIVHLTWSQIHFEKRLIQIRNTECFTTKSGKNRNVPIGEELLILLEMKYQNTMEKHSYIFQRNGKPYRHEYVSKKLKQYIRKTELDDRLHFHSLRHSFITWALERGASLHQVSKVAGHSSTAITEKVYGHIKAEELHHVANLITINK